jgi:prepilin-type N-terminal cleavage/methylation domain-containing protein
VTRPRRAYTLLELVIVCALLAIAAAVAAPTVSALYNQHRLGVASDAVREAWARARARAIEDGRPYRFSVVPGTGRFRVAPDSPDFWNGSASSGSLSSGNSGGMSSGSGGPASGASSSGRPPLVYVQRLPNGIPFILDGTAGPVAATDDDELSPSTAEDDDDTSANWQTVAVFLPDGTAQDDATITLQRNGNSRTATITLRALTCNTSVQYGTAGEGR